VSKPGFQVSSGFVHVTSAKMTEIFETVVSEIIRLVRTQMARTIRSQHRPISKILLVGGFGSSQYLLTRFKNEFETGNVTVMRSPNAWTAVVRGAVIKELAASNPNMNWNVHSRVSRATYGIACMHPFQAGVHPEHLKSWDNFEVRNMCHRSSRWFVRRGQQINEREPIRVGFYRVVPLNSTFIFTDVVYENLDDVAPGYISDNCRKLGVLTTDLSAIPKWKFERKTGGDYVERYHIEFSIIYTFYAAHFDVKFEFQGSTYSSVRLDLADTTTREARR